MPAGCRLEAAQNMQIDRGTGIEECGCVTKDFVVESFVGQHWGNEAVKESLSAVNKSLSGRSLSNAVWPQSSSAMVILGKEGER